MSRLRLRVLGLSCFNNSYLAIPQVQKRDTRLADLSGGRRRVNAKTQSGRIGVVGRGDRISVGGMVMRWADCGRGKQNLG
jgi:hypothetical protein